MNRNNAIFNCFKPSGKWKYGDWGYLPKETFDVFEGKRTAARRRIILDANDGKFPGTIGTCSDLIWVIIPDDACDWGWPLMLFPDEGGEDE